MKDIQSIKQRFGIIGNYSGLNRAIDIAVQVAPTDLSVLITGESGTGKEVFPQVIHSYSTRKHGQYIAVNCGAIPEGTIDSELFGHEKGAFTGATESRKGYFEVADKGTIFLDEVAELPLSTQVRLLRVLETGEFIRVGSSKVQRTDVRVIAASNVDVAKAIEHNKFREDLFYRLNTVPIKIPPLRERGEDIFLLFRKFAVDFAEKYRMPSIRLSNEAKDLLLSYSWPGNVRQLENVIKRLILLSTQRVVSLEDVTSVLEFEEIGMAARRAETAGPPPAPSGSLISEGVKTIEEMEREHLEKTLKHFNYNISITARALDISRKTMHNKLKKYNIVIRRTAAMEENAGAAVEGAGHQPDHRAERPPQQAGRHST